MAMRCFCPPERRNPPSPTRVLYPSGSSVMNECAFAILQAVSTASRRSFSSAFSNAVPIMLEVRASQGEIPMTDILKNSSTEQDRLLTYQTHARPQEFDIERSNIVSIEKDFAFNGVIEP